LADIQQISLTFWHLLLYENVQGAVFAGVGQINHHVRTLALQEVHLGCTLRSCTHKHTHTRLIA